MQLISKKLYNKKHASYYESTCSLNEFDEKSNHTKISKFWILKKSATRQKDHF
jgi:hypothetical protein